MGYSSIGRLSEFSNRKEGALASISERYEVVKAVMDGSVCYAAVREKGGTRIKCVVIPTVIDYNGWLCTRPLGEDCGPIEAKCPMSILNLLTPPETEEGELWRERCIKWNKTKKGLSGLPFGSVIQANGWTLVKMRPAYQFKTWWLKVKDTNQYIPKKEICEYKLISLGE